MGNTLKTNQEIAYEVLQGLWGNGQDRRNRLTQAGYDYDKVQSIVNALVAGKPVPQEPTQNNIIITGKDMMEIEVDLSRYKGISLTFVSGGD